MPQWWSAIVSAGIALLVLSGIAYWTWRAQTDRSARVGLYLIFGIPGALLILAGAVVLIRGDRTLGTLLLLIGLGLGLPLLRPVRAALARVTPLDPDSSIDMAGLCIVFGLIGLFVGNSLAPSAESPPAADSLPAFGLLELLLQAVSFLAIAYIAVGLPYWRNLREATARLGIETPTRRTFGFAGMGVVAAFVVMGIASAAAQQLEPGLNESLNEIVDQITSQVQNPLGAFILGASAGIGEEAIFRGALQPRYGLIIPSILFTLLHGPQYGFNVALIGLFGVSIILGLERKYANTTAAMITHALYNAIPIIALWAGK